MMDEINKASSSDDDLSFLTKTSILVPAVMTLVCFICTVLSLTVAGFICARDREAQDESERLNQQKKVDDYVSKVLTLFYKVRTYNVFRVFDIIEEKNEDRPAWCASKSEVVMALEDLGIYPTEYERSQMSRDSEIFEIDAEPLFYFELERYAKATVVYGPNSVDYYACIQQDGVAFPRDFFPDTRPVFEKELIAGLHKEMVEITELFVLLLTGIDLNILRCGSLPKQFHFAQLPQELTCLEDFFYNYYLRVYPRGRTDTVVPPRTQPSLPLTPSQEPPSSSQTVDQDLSDTETQDDVYLTVDPAMESTKHSDPDDSYSDIGSLSDVKESIKRRQEWGQRLQKQRRRASAVYTRISQKVRRKTKREDGIKGEETLRPMMQEVIDDEDMDRGGENLTSTESTSQDYGLDGDIPDRSDEEPENTYSKHPEKNQVPILRINSQEQTIQPSRPAPRLVRKAGSNRRRGKLKTQRYLEHNSFTYMIAKVVEFLNGRMVTEKRISGKRFWKVNRNFIV